MQVTRAQRRAALGGDAVDVVRELGAPGNLVELEGVRRRVAFALAVRLSGGSLMVTSSASWPVTITLVNLLPLSRGLIVVVVQVHLHFASVSRAKCGQRFLV